MEATAADGLVALEGNVPGHHVVQEDSQRPDGQPVPVVTLLDNPLGRGVHVRACKVQGKDESIIFAEATDTHHRSQ